MKRTLVAVALGVALLTGATTAPAHPGHTKGKRCAEVKRGFVVRGTITALAGFGDSVAGNETVTITVRKANRHARRALDGQTTLTVDFNDVKRLKLVGRDGFGTDPNDVQVGDRVRAIGKVEYQKRGSRRHPCANGGEYGDVTIRYLGVRAVQS